MATRADLLLRAPELATIPVDEVTAALADAVLQVNPTVFGRRTDLAIILLAAHHLAMAHPDTVTMVVQSETVGPISTTYATGAVAQGAGGSPFAETSYGRRYLLLLRQVQAIGPMVV